MKKIVSSYRPTFAIVLVALLTLVSALTMYADLNGKGLAGSMYYAVLGVMIYPIFYGSMAYGIYGLVKLIRNRRVFASITPDRIILGQRELPISEISSIQTTRNLFGFKMLTVRQGDGRKFSLLAAIFTRPIEDVANELNQALAQTPRSLDP